MVMVILSLLFAVILPFTFTELPVPDPPLVTLALPAATAVQATLLICALTISVMARLVALLGPLLVATIT
ncbi:hypothetical protein D3C85_1120330 [compost metagenome]